METSFSTQLQQLKASTSFLWFKQYAKAPTISSFFRVVDKGKGHEKSNLIFNKISRNSQATLILTSH